MDHRGVVALRSRDRRRFAIRTSSAAAIATEDAHRGLDFRPQLKGQITRCRAAPTPTRPAQVVGPARSLESPLKPWLSSRRYEHSRGTRRPNNSSVVAFKARVRAIDTMGIRDPPTSFRSPWQRDMLNT